MMVMECGMGKVNGGGGRVEVMGKLEGEWMMSRGVGGGMERWVKVMEVVVREEIV